MNKIPVNIITGFLGAGKTTAIIKLLSMLPEGEEWAVIVNEFGKIPVDDKIIENSGTASQKVFNIAGGCICCSAERYFRENLEEIAGPGYNFKRILIEPSGLGGPDMVKSVIREIPRLSPGVSICLTDITLLNKPRIQANHIYQDQIRKADAVVFSKTDLINTNSLLEDLIEEFNSKFLDKKVFFQTDNEVMQFLLSENPDALNSSINKPTVNFQALENELSDRNYNQFVFHFPSERTFEGVALADFFGGFDQILRAKGFIKTSKGWRLFNFSPSGFELTETKAMDSSMIVIITSNTSQDYNSIFGKILEKIAD